MAREIIFATCRHRHDSYRDWRTLIETSGKEWVYYEEVDLSRNAVYVCSPIEGSFRPGIRHQRATHGLGVRAKVVWWNLERPVAGELDPNGVHAGVDPLNGYVDRCWVYDRHFLAMICAKTPSYASRWSFVPVGSSARMRAPGPELPREHLWTHLAYVTGRRGEIFGHVARVLGAQAVVPDIRADPVERDQLLKKIRFMVNAHQDDYPFIEPTRVAVAAAYSMPLISEWIQDPWPMGPEDFLNTRTGDLAGQAMALASSPDAQRALGERLHRRLCIEHEFVKNVELAVEEQFA